jgi:serine/threonine-protein kinase
MGIETVVTLIDALRESRLLDDKQLRAVEELAPTQFEQPRDMARELVNRGWLTRYQAKQILQGQGGELVLGAYRLLERLGEGGMGEVFKALHQPMSRIVALKVVRPELLQDERALKRFRREVQAAAKLTHPNIVTVFDAAQAGQIHFLAMEFIDGMDLADMVRESGPLSVLAGCDYIRQAALGLQHAHDRGLVHRDVKPSNLLVTRNNPAGVVKILDLGLARPLQTEAFNSKQSSITIDGTVVGTPDFMAPEQAKRAAAVDHRADIYGLGCTLYFVLTGRLPFPTGNPMEKLIQHQLDQPYPVEMLRNDVPPALLAVLQRMIAKNPEDRLQSGMEVAAALELFCAPSPNTPTVPVAVRNDGVLGHPEGKPHLEKDAKADPKTKPPSTSSPFRFDDDSPPQQDGQRVRTRRRGTLVLIGAAAAFLLASIIGLALIVGSLRHKPVTIVPTQAIVVDPVVPPQTPEELVSASIQEDASSVLIVRAGQLFQSPPMQHHGRELLKPLLELLTSVRIDPYKQFDRAIISYGRDDPQQILIVVLGDYMTPDFRKLLDKTWLPEEITWPDHISSSVYRTTKLEKGRTEYLAVFQEKYVAIATDQNVLKKAYARFQDRRRIAANDALRKSLATTKSDATIRVAVLPSQWIGDKRLEEMSVFSASGEIQVSEDIHYHFQFSVKDAKAFMAFKEKLTREFGRNSLFNQGLLASMLLANAETKPRQPIGDTAIVDMSGKLSQKELDRALPEIFRTAQKK